MANDKALKMLKTALEMEEKGKAFYDKAIAACKNDLGREIFSQLASDEVIHVKRIKSIYETLSGGKGWSEEWTKMNPSHGNLNAVFKDLATKHGKDIKADTKDIEALDVGIDLESKSVAFYSEHLKTAADPLEKKFTEKMVGEEKSHFKVLSDMKLYLTNPAAYFVEVEHAGMDGM